MNTLLTLSGWYYLATDKAECQSYLCSYIFIASYGLFALMNSSSASLNLFSSSKCKAYFKWTSGNLYLAWFVASLKASSNLSWLASKSTAASIKPFLIRN